MFIASEWKDYEVLDTGDGEKLELYKLDVNGTCSFAQNHPFLLMSVLEGSGIVNGQPVKKGDHFILPCGFGEVEMQGEMSLVVSTVPAQA